jgi:hypothetical protein
MTDLNSVFSAPSFVSLIQDKMATIFQIAEIECSRDGKMGMEVGVTREYALTALFIAHLGRSRVNDRLPITTHEHDVEIDNIPISIKTITGKGGIKVSWTVDPQVARSFAKSYSPSCGIVLVRINWGLRSNREPSGFFWIPLEAQTSIMDRMGTENYLKLPKPNTNPRGIELSRLAVERLLQHPKTISIPVNWKKTDQSYDKLGRWIKMWTQ